MIPIVLTNCIKIYDFTDENIRGIIKSELTADNPTYTQAKKMGYRTFDIPKFLSFFLETTEEIAGKVYTLFIVPRGYLKRLKELVNCDYIVDTTQAGHSIKLDLTGNIELRNYQQAALDTTVNETIGLIEAPAGSGKTILGMHIIQSKGKKALWITHTHDLLNQAIEAANICIKDLKIGTISAKKDWSSDCDIIFATVQSLTPEIIYQLNTFIGTTVIDEVHHYASSVFSEVIMQINSKHLYGLTSTPERKDGLTKALNFYLGEILIRIDRQALYDSGKLIKPIIEFIYTEFSTSTAGLQSEFGAYDAGGGDTTYNDILNVLYDDETRKKQISVNIVNHCNKGFALVLSDSIKYCHEIKERVMEEYYSKHGIVPRVALIHGGVSQYKWLKVGSKGTAERMEKSGQAKRYKYNKGYFVEVEAYSEDVYNKLKLSKKDREQILINCKEGRYDILFATKLAKEGLDLPNLIVGHKISPAKGDTKESASGGNIEQEIGRLQRPFKGKENAYWFDYVDDKCGVFKNQYYSRRKVYLRLGLITPTKPKKSTCENKGKANIINVKSKLNI